MAQDMFLKIEGVEGEARDEKHKGEIDVKSFSWGATQSGSMHQGGGGGSGKVSVQDLHITKPLDKSSPELALRCCTGKHFPTAELVVRKAGDEPLEYYKIKMADVLISSYNIGATGDSERLYDTMTLNFSKIDIEYKQQSSSGGSEADATMKFNIATNKANE
jgi:type VI secretion system secreted protein Hcp